MLRITRLSGEELTTVPCTDLSDVKALKRRLCQHHGLPQRFCQRVFHEGNILDDAVRLDSAMDLQVLTLARPVHELLGAEAQRAKLYEAARSGRFAEVEEMLQVPLHPDTGHNFHTLEPEPTPLMGACLEGRLEVVALLLEAMAQVLLNDGHHTALMLAAMNGHAPVVKLLLENGARVDQVCYRSDTTALMLAAGYGHAPVVELLLEAGVAKDVCELECGARYTALMQASGNGHAQVVQLLLEAGADKDVCVYGYTALMLATSRGRDEVRRLLEASA